MKKIIPLNQGWRFGWQPYTGRVNAAGGPRHDIADLPNTCTFDATVPGVVQMDLERHGVVPDLFVGMNADHALWVEDSDWWYCLDFDGPQLGDDTQAQLVFHGLDTFATVWLNGTVIGQSENMFIRHRFDATQHLKQGEPNQLVVRLAAPRYGPHIDETHGPLYCAPERIFTRKAQMSYGWDIAPRLVTVGIWRPVELELIHHARIDNAWVRTLAIEGNTVRCRVEAEIDWLGCEAAAITLAGNLHGQSFAIDGTCKPGLNSFGTEVVIENAPLWWPVGYGDANLVDARLDLQSNGETLDTWQQQVALCTVACVQEAQPSGATSFKFAVNGQDILVTGFNYTPLDSLFPRVTDARLSSVLERMRQINCNMLRLWGGGIYERPHFYEECQRLGILIWQDFMLSCAYYPQDDAFAEVLTEEATQVVKDLRRFGNLAIWCGDNEGDMFFGECDWYSNRPLRETFPAVVKEFDPDRTYIPSSPFTPGSTVSGTPEAGDVHCWAHGTPYTDARFTATRSRFVSEFGRLSLPSLACIRAYLPAGSELPLTNWMWRYHAADTHRVKHYRGALQIVEEIEGLGKTVPDSIEELVTLSQQIHADALEHWIDAYCEDPEFGGCLVWNVGDCWPQQSDAVIDYLGNEKPAMARVAEVFARVQAQFKARATVGD